MNPETQKHINTVRAAVGTHVPKKVEVGNKSLDALEQVITEQEAKIATLTDRIETLTLRERDSHLAKEADRLGAEKAELVGVARALFNVLAIANVELSPSYAAILSKYGDQPESQPLPCHTQQTYQPDPVEEEIRRLTEHREGLLEMNNGLSDELKAARDEANALRAERDRYAKIIDRL